MSRSMIPSQSQLEKLADMFERHNYLASGHARTAHARNRTRAAWQEVATVLNSEGNGCIKTWQQWAKYWKDKKSALKKKVSLLNIARRRTGGGALEQEIHLTPIEERFLAIVGGEGFAIGDREMEINPFENPPEDEPEPLPPTPPPVASQSPVFSLNISDEQSAAPTGNSESILQVLDTFAGEIEPNSMVVQAGTLVMNETQLPEEATSEPQPGPSRHGFSHQPSEIIESPRRAPESLGQNRHATSASSPRRRRITQARRRLLQRTPPAQRNSQMASLTERFIAIEERRVEVEMMHARSMDTMAQSFDRTSRGFLQQGQALQSLAESIKRLLDRDLH